MKGNGRNQRLQTYSVKVENVRMPAELEIDCFLKRDASTSFEYTFSCLSSVVVLSYFLFL